MLEKPDLQDQLIIDRLQDEYGLQVTQVTFLPLGYDVNTAVYRLVTEHETEYFLKLRKGAFNEMTAAIPQFLKAQGIQAIISPLMNRKRRLWGNLQDYKIILYPFIQGKNGYEVALSDQHCIDFGVAIKGIHTAEVPPAFRPLIQHESYSSHWREIVRTFQAQAEYTPFEDSTAAKLAEFMQAKRGEIRHMVERAEQLGLALQARSLEFVLCHSDLHPGNLLIGENDASGHSLLYIVDWDNPILAPKERDLMFIGMSRASAGAREEALFYQGYSGDCGCALAEADQMALAYYRYERIIQDIAAFCEQLFLTVEGGEDREQAYQYFISQFLPNHEVETACKTDQV